ncbi:MAG TPA: hypothetical protein VEW03_06155, partial [Longimicrobiaceae bacterium]|nr:hypothetical protein [Longimicrobiaceae bacterium]
MQTRASSFSAFRRVGAALTLALAVAACASAEKRYEQGMELEQRGRPADAAERYIDALKKDPRLADARPRLQESGDRAVMDYLGEAGALEAAGRADEAVDVLLRLDALRRDAAAVGVTLSVPADYLARRRATLDRAVDDAIRAALELARAGRPDDADRRLARAVDRFEPSPAQRAALARARAEAAIA